MMVRILFQILLLAGAVVSHKFVVAFCLGLELVGSASSVFKNVLAIAFFSFGSVLGIGIGMLAIKVSETLTRAERYTSLFR